MANEQRVREDYKTGTITDDPLTDVATTLTSDELVAVREVTTEQHMQFVLDPTGAGNGPETAWITEHEAGADTATISRGMEGTDPVEHAQGTGWSTGPGSSDYMQVVAADDELDTRTGLPYASQSFYDIAGDVTLVGAPSREGPLYAKSDGEVGLPWNVAWGELDVVESSSLLAAGISGVFGDLNLSLSVDLRAGRVIEIKASGAFIDSDSSQSAYVTLTGPTNSVFAHLGIVVCEQQEVTPNRPGFGVLDASYTLHWPFTNTQVFKLRAYAARGGLVDFGGHLGRVAYLRVIDHGPYTGP